MKSGTWSLSPKKDKAPFADTDWSDWSDNSEDDTDNEVEVEVLVAGSDLDNPPSTSAESGSGKQGIEGGV
jgi:hypothetical protein